ncbi:MAG: ATP-binding protein [Calditrichaeota bacterium]|nr:ATP-binding protein [Calditrichota bacterium]
MMMSEEKQKYRILQNYLPQSNEKGLILLTGARQTGKTTLAKLTYPELKYINLDAPENRELVREISTHSWGKDIGNAIIDEAQKEPIVFDKIKFSYDEKEITFQVILGSSQILLMKNIRESLAGRVSIHELWPLLMSEICYDKANTLPPAPLIDKIITEKSLEEVFLFEPSALFGREQNGRLRAEQYLLKWGAMPALLHIPDDKKRKWLRDYEYTYLERDIADLARLTDLMPFRKFQKLSALRSAQLLNYSELARDAGVSVDTARRYLQYLTISYQVILLQPYFKNITSSLVKTPKLYWLDVGLFRTLTGFLGEMSGQLFETMVVSEIFKWIKTRQRDAEIYFYRTRSGLEIDLLITTPDGVIGLEIKSRDKIAQSDFTGLVKIANILGREWKGGIVIYRGVKIKKLAEPNIWAVPSYRLFT